MPKYSFQEFFEACKKGNKVTVLAEPLKNARFYFQLATTKDILDFISNGGLQNRTFVNTNRYEDFPIPDEKVMFDAYHFESGMMYGYIAFFKSPINDDWVIKSFKPDDESDPRNLIFDYGPNLE